MAQTLVLKEALFSSGTYLGSHSTYKCSKAYTSLHLYKYGQMHTCELKKKRYKYKWKILYLTQIVNRNMGPGRTGRKVIIKSYEKKEAT